MDSGNSMTYFDYYIKTPTRTALISAVNEKGFNFRKEDGSINSSPSEGEAFYNDDLSGFIKYLAKPILVPATYTEAVFEEQEEIVPAILDEEGNELVPQTTKIVQVMVTAPQEITPAVQSTLWCANVRMTHEVDWGGLDTTKPNNPVNDFPQ